jgi:hypothetical protein
MAKKSTGTGGTCVLCGMSVLCTVCAIGWNGYCEKHNCGMNEQNPIPPEAAQCEPNKTETDEVLCPRYFLKKKDKN